MEKLAYRRVVARVALLQGGVERLAGRLDVSSSLVTRWVEGLAPIPPDVFLRCVDLLLEHQLPPSGPARSTAADEPRLDPINK